MQLKQQTESKNALISLRFGRCVSCVCCVLLLRRLRKEVCKSVEFFCMRYVEWKLGFKRVCGMALANN